MKIAILNLSIDNNYGGNLQRFALCKVLQDKGYEVEFVKRFTLQYYSKFPKNIIKYGIRYAKKLFIDRKTVIFEERLREWDNMLQMSQTLSFIEKHVPCYKKNFYPGDSLKELNNAGFDAIIVGSDQVFRAPYNRGEENFFLGFITNPSIRKIAYGASFGNAGEDYTPELISRCSQDVSQFHSVSLREKSGIDLFRNFGWKAKTSPRLVLDPTLLLDASEYESLVDNNIANKGIFCYVLDMSDDKLNFIRDVSKKLDISYTILDGLFPNLQRGTFKHPVQIPTIGKWLAQIKNADFIITDSYHGTIFSIIFNKPFFSIVNCNRGKERFSFLEEEFGLSGLFLSKPLIKYDMNKPFQINWKLVNDKISEIRLESIDFLDGSLC